MVGRWTPDTLHRRLLSCTPQSDQRNPDAPRIHSRPRIRHGVVGDRHVQRHIERTSAKERQGHVVEITSWQLGRVTGELGISVRHASYHEGDLRWLLTTAAAKRGKTSSELRCAPLARASWHHSASGSLPFQVSRLVLGLRHNAR